MFCNVWQSLMEREGLPEGFVGGQRWWLHSAQCTVIAHSVQCTMYSVKDDGCTVSAACAEMMVIKMIQLYTYNAHTAVAAEWHFWRGDSLKSVTQRILGGDDTAYHDTVYHGRLWRWHNVAFYCPMPHEEKLCKRWTWNHKSPFVKWNCLLLKQIIWKQISKQILLCLINNLVHPCQMWTWNYKCLRAKCYFLLLKRTTGRQLNPLLLCKIIHWGYIKH